MKSHFSIILWSLPALLLAVIVVGMGSFLQPIIPQSVADRIGLKQGEVEYQTVAGEQRRRVFRRIEAPHAPQVTRARVAVAPVPIEPVFAEPPVPSSMEENVVAEEPIAVSAETGETERERDARKALGLAETYYRRGAWESAGEWYLNALEWDPSNQTAAEGFVLSAFNAGQYQHAYRISGELGQSIPGVRELLLEAANHEAHQLLKDNRIEQAAELLEQFPLQERGLDDVRRLQRSMAAGQSYPEQVSLDRDHGMQLMQGWMLYHHGQYEASAQTFAQIFKTQTDRESARGLIASMQSAGRSDQLLELAQRMGGIFAEELEAQTGTTAVGLTAEVSLPVTVTEFY